MSFLSISRGAQPNDNTGDNLREGARKINSNFSEIYSNLGDGTSILFNYNTYKLNQINDVNTVPQHDYVLQWNSTNSEWIAVGKLTGNVVGHMIPDANNVHDLGSANNNFRDFYIAGNTVFNPGEQRLFSDG